MTKLLYARAGATAIAAALALSPTYAASTKPIVDMSASPALSGKAQAGPKAAAKSASGPLDERTMELGGGALALFALGAGAFVFARRRRNGEPLLNEERHEEPMSGEFAATPRHDPIVDERPATASPERSAFAWDHPQPAEGVQRQKGETWVERAYRGPSPDNPSLSLRTRLKRAAFFDKRERDAAAGKAKPVNAGAGLPDAMVEEHELESA